jgi:hypothetical protein
MPIQLTDLHQCQWCDEPIHTAYGAGRPRNYCSAICRDEAYKERKRRMPGRNEKRCPDCFLVHAGECI